MKSNGMKFLRPWVPGDPMLPWIRFSRSGNLSGNKAENTFNVLIRTYQPCMKFFSK